MKHHLLLAAFATTCLVSGATASEPPLQKSSADLRVPEAWYATVTDFEIRADLTMGAPGLTMSLGLHQHALRPGYFSTSTTFMGMDMLMVCDMESLWTENRMLGNFSAEPWNGEVAAASPGASSLFQIYEPPYPFELPLRLIALDPDDDDERYVLSGSDTLSVNGKTVICDVWDLVPPEGDESTARIWLDPSTSLMMRSEMLLLKPGKPQFSGSMSVEVLEINPGLQPGDFEFRPGPGSRRVSEPSKLQVSDSLEGTMPPDFTLEGSDGTAVATRDWRGRFVILDFWATWCQPCIKSIPHLEALRQECGDDVVIVGISSEAPAKIGKFLAEREVGYPILIDAKHGMTDAYRVSSLPTIFMLDRDGVVREQFVGLQTPETLRDALARLRNTVQEESGPAGE